MTDPEFPIDYQDQLDAAITETSQVSQRLVEDGARLQHTREDESPYVFRALIGAYREACQDAMIRYENETPPDQRVKGRGRSNSCGHQNAHRPRPIHWVPVKPDCFWCDHCWELIHAQVDRCMMCGQPNEPMTHITTALPDTPITLHAVVCDDCYPEGVGAPNIGR
jgi:hypothetical protein